MKITREHHSRPVGLVRADQYPVAGDALDAIMKGFEALRDQGVSLPRETLTWIADCRRIKDNFPKE